MTAALAFYQSETDAPAKRAIMAAALSLFAQDGVDGVSIRDIAARAGFTNPALFRHFDGKDALALALFDKCYRHLAAVVQRPAPDDFDAALGETLRRYLALIDSDRAAVLFVQDNLRRLWPLLPTDRRGQSLLGHMRALVESGQRQGRVAAAIDPTLAAGAVIGILAQTARLVDAGELPLPAAALAGDVERLVRAMLRG